jgi:hypothetical protein
MEGVVTADKEKRAKAIAAYADKLRTLMRGDLSTKARDDYESARLALVEAGVEDKDADFVAIVSELRP